MFRRHYPSRLPIRPGPGLDYCGARRSGLQGLERDVQSQSMTALLLILPSTRDHCRTDTSRQRHDHSRRPSGTARSSAGINFTLVKKIDRRMLSNFRSSAILDAQPRHDIIALRAGTFCLTALRFPQFRIERLQKSLPHTNAGRCFAHYSKPPFHVRAQHGAPNVRCDGSVRVLNDRQGM